jgi:hypothetical protein
MVKSAKCLLGRFNDNVTWKTQAWPGGYENEVQRRWIL